MSDMLSQQDIDAMLAQSAAGQSLSGPEIDTLGEIGNISMGSAATALNTILGRKVRITTPEVTLTTMQELVDSHQMPYLVVNVGYSEGFSGHNLFILKLDDVKIMTDIMMGGDGQPDLEAELSELHISAISEAMNQMMGGMSTSMAEMFNRMVNITPPVTNVVQLSDEQLQAVFPDDGNELVNISFKMEIEGLVDSRIMQLMPLAFSKSLVGELVGVPEPPAKKPAEKPAPAPASPAPQPAQAVNARPISLPSFDEPGASQAIVENSIDLILDVPLLITVELGQCRKTIKEIMDINVGSVIALDKLAGEPVDVVANGKAVAKGEVIVVDENFGIRITEVLSAGKRIRLAK